MKCIIIHGSPSSKKRAEEAPQNVQHWIPWLRKRLKSKNYKTYAPLMPRSWDPKYKDWKAVFEKIKFGKDTILIGHSAGGAFLVRWLAENKKKIKKLILISPGKVGRWGTKNLTDLYGTKTIKNLDKYVKDEIVVFTADDDISYHIPSAKQYSKELPAKLIHLGEGYGHFCLNDMGTKEFPELLKEVLR